MRRVLVPGICGTVTLLAGCDAMGAAETITNFQQFNELPLEHAAQGWPVRFRGVVLNYDQEWGQLHVHDGHSARWFDARLIATQPQVGQRVEITGTTIVVANYSWLTNLSLAVLGQGQLPPAKRLALSQLAGDLGQWVEVRGRVLMVDFSSGRPLLLLRENEQSCQVFIMGSPSAPGLESLRGAWVQARGINDSKTIEGRLARGSVMVPGPDRLTVIEPAGTNALPPVSSVDGLLNRELGDWTNHPVRVGGVVLSSDPGKSLVIRDATGVLRAQVRQSTAPRPGERVDLFGYLDVTSPGVVLKDAWFEVLKLRPLTIPLPVAPNTNTARSSEVETRISRVLKLRAEDLVPGVPVRLRGVVLYAHFDWHSGYLHDCSGSVYFDLKQPEVRAGDLIELTGEASVGAFAPVILNTSVRVLGRTNFPAPAQVDLTDMGDGHLDAQWIQMEGVVRGIRQEPGRLHLRLMSAKGQFNAVIPGWRDQPTPEHLVDAMVSVQGICRSILNARGQFVNVELQVPTLEQVTVLEPAPDDPFGIEPTPIAAVATFDPERLAGRRIKVSGVVTLVTPEQGFFVQDESGGLRVRARAEGKLRPGDRVDVLGFPAGGAFSPELEEASYQRTGHGALPAAQPTSAEEILAQGQHDGREVTLTARLVQDVPRSASPQLVVQEGAVIFTARVEAAAPGRRLPAWPSGSVVRLSGVCSIQGDEELEPHSFRLRLRSAADAQLLARPPWWTARQTLWSLSGLLGMSLLAFAWVGALRRQVGRQTRTLRAEIAEREKMQVQIENTHKQLLVVSHQAGMAEVATSVLHNVGNVLNSVNISASVIADRLQASKTEGVARVTELLEAHRHDLPGYFAANGRTEQLINFLRTLAQHLASERKISLAELVELTNHIGHIKEIVAMQQSYARVSGVTEPVSVLELVEDALRMNGGALARHGVQLVRKYPEHLAPIIVDKHKVLQVLVNLIRNAKHACDDSTALDKRLTVQVIAPMRDGDRVRILVVDNGVGIPPENLTRIFSHGFTTRKNGHGFGLHSGALAARELGGSLTAHSDGLGRGATFTLELPTHPKNHANDLEKPTVTTVD